MFSVVPQAEAGGLGSGGRQPLRAGSPSVPAAAPCRQPRGTRCRRCRSRCGARVRCVPRCVPQLLALTSPGDGSLCSKRDVWARMYAVFEPGCGVPFPQRPTHRPSRAGKLLWPQQSTGDPAHPSLAQPQLSV